MSKYHRRNKPKKKRKIRHEFVRNLDHIIGEDLLKSIDFQEDLRVIETPFGDIKVHDGATLYTLKNKGVLLEILTFNEKVEEDNTIDRLIYFEKLKDKYPKEPYIAYEIAECYNQLERDEKYDELVVENFEKFRGYPAIDITYLILKFFRDEENLVEEVFGNALNLHIIYPEYKVFDIAVVTDFYFLLGMVSKKEKELELARKFAEIVSETDTRKGLILKTGIDFEEKPWLKWRGNLMLILILVAILGIIGGILWGIVSVFQMIF